MAGTYLVKSNVNTIRVAEGEKANLVSYLEYFNILNSDVNNLIFEVKDSSVAKLVDPDDTVRAELKYNELGKAVEGIKMGTTSVVVKYTDEVIGVVQVEVIPANTKIKPQVATGSEHTVTLKVDGTVWTYGDNTYGQLGLGSIANTDEPKQVQFAEGIKIVDIAVGDYHSVALDSNGTVWAWGRNDYYQLGTSGQRNTPIKLNSVGSKIKKISASSNLTVMLTEDGFIYTNGINENGEAGNSSYSASVTYSKAKYMNNIIDIAAGKNHVLALRCDGTVYAVGSNRQGALGLGNKDRIRTNEYIKLELANIAYIEANENSSAAITTDGKLYVWGENTYGQLGTNDKNEKLKPVELGLQNVKEVSIGKNHTTVRDGAGKIYAVGYNTYGQHGDNDRVNKTKYAQIDTIEDVIDISSGNTYTVVLKADGSVYGYGDYYHGVIGKVTKTKSIYPVQVGRTKVSMGVEDLTLKQGTTKSIQESIKYEFNLIYISAKNLDMFSFRSLNDNKATVDEQGNITGIEIGSTWVVARNKETLLENIVMVRVVDENSEIAPKVEGGIDYGVILKADKTIWSFGYNGDGQLGLDSNNSTNIPMQNNIVSTYKDITVGNNFALVLREDGRVWGFGDNSKGQLGLKDVKNSPKLVEIQGLSNIVVVSAGENHSVALTDDGILYGFGDNSKGQLGQDNIGKNTTVPTKINVVVGDILSIDAGKDQTVIVNSEGKVYGFGSILNGMIDMQGIYKAQVGDGYILLLTKDNTVCKYSNGKIEVVSKEQNAIDIDVKDNVNMYQTIDGKVYTWGTNSEGQLGQNSKDSIVSPKEVETHGDNIFRIGSGYHNTYVIANTGLVYDSINF